MPAESAYAAPAPNAAAPNHASHNAGARLKIATTAPMYATPKRVRAMRSSWGIAWSAARPAAAPAPKRAMSTPNSASLACRTLRTNTIPSEKSAPSPSATESAAGITARTNGMRNASRNRTCCSSPGATVGAPSWRSREMHANDTRKVAASMKNTSAKGRPARWNGIAATAAKRPAPSGMLPYDDPSTRPLASGSWSPSTRSGIDASRAGRNTMLAASSRKPQRYTHHSARTKGTRAIITARIRSIASIVRRRSQRADTRVASGPPIDAGSRRSVRMPPTAVGESVSWRTSAMNATVPIQSPSEDTP